MTKPATKWKDANGYDLASPDNEDFSLLLETGDNILLETGDEMLLEPTVITVKPPTAWSEA